MKSHPEWNAVLGHELRSPVAAILGYQELLDEGTLGELPPAAADALRRIRMAAAQLMALIDAVEGSSDGQQPVELSAAELIDDAIRTVLFDAEGRATRIEHDGTAHGGGVRLLTRRTDACRALALILGTAVKVTPGGTLTVTAHAHGPRISVAGGRLDPRRDQLSPDRALTGAALRLELAGAAASRIGGAVHLQEDGSVHLHLPHLRPD